MKATDFATLSTWRQMADGYTPKLVRMTAVVGSCMCKKHFNKNGGYSQNGAGRGLRGNFVHGCMLDMAGCVRLRKTHLGRATSCSFCLKTIRVILIDDLCVLNTWKIKRQNELEQDIIGSAEALPILCIRCTRWEREIQTEREWDGSDITLVALKLAKKFALFLAKTLKLAIQAIEFSAEPSFSSKKWIKLIPKTIGNRKKRLCVRLRSGDKHHLRKSSDRKAQTRRRSFRSPDWFVLFDLKIFSGGVYPPSATSRTISFFYFQ